LIENAIREDVHPYEEAMAYKTLLETSEPRHDVASIAAKTGRSITHVYQRIRLAELIPDAVAAANDSHSPGMPVKSFKGAKTAAGRIWERIQSLGEPAKPKAERKAKGCAQAAKGKATKKTTPAKKAPKAAKGAKEAKAARQESGPREGSKKAQVVAMLQRKNGAPLAEIAIGTS
jgi:ParB-like chromosome segregation protein Spo0J